MRRFLGLPIVLFLAGQAQGQQYESRIYTNPVPPSREILDRLNLKLAWSAYMPMDGKKDALLAIRHTGKHLLVQTRSGLVSQIDADTGQSQWRTRVGLAYRGGLPLTSNSSQVFVVSNAYLYALDRASGQVDWQMDLPRGLSAAPIVDEDQLYLVTASDQLMVYRLPLMDVVRAALAAQAQAQRSEGESRSAKSGDSQYGQPEIRSRPPGQVDKFGPQPVLSWTATLTMRLDLQPVQSNGGLLLPNTGGVAVGFTKVLQPNQGPNPIYRFTADGDFQTSPGVYEDMAYLGSRDSNAYAVNIDTGRTLWRFSAGSPISRRPLATAQDVYVSSDKGGLVRLDRATGEPQWRIVRGNRVFSGQPDVDRVLAVNPKFVYATDRSDRLVILDRARGTILSTHDMRAFTVLTPNDWTDRLYLAAHNGLLVCLHDREHVEPHRHREGENSLQRRLEGRPVKLTAINGRPLSAVLRAIEAECRVKILISKPAFTDAGREPINDKPVTLQKVEEANLKDALQKLLDEFHATFVPIEETLLVVPKEGKPPEKPKEKEPEKEKPPEKEKEKEKKDME
jgi:outer membrane protein assembly factor BamB